MKKILVTLVLLIVSTSVFADGGTYQPKVWSSQVFVSDETGNTSYTDNQDNVYHIDTWSTYDTIMEIPYQTLLIVDYMQTRKGIGKPMFMEQDPLIGPHPNMRTLNIAYVVLALGHFAISYLLPEQWRDSWQVATAGVEGMVVISNNQAGFHATFQWGTK